MKKRKLILNVTGIGALLFFSTGALAGSYDSHKRFDGRGHDHTQTVPHRRDARVDQDRHRNRYDRHEWTPENVLGFLLHEQRREARFQNRQAHRYTRYQHPGYRHGRGHAYGHRHGHGPFAGRPVHHHPHKVKPWRGKPQSRLFAGNRYDRGSRH